MLRRVRTIGGRDRRGAVVVLVAVCSTVVVGFAAMTIDLGNMYIVRTELQRAADSAALAGVAKLARYHFGPSERAAKEEAQRIVGGNPVDGKVTKIDVTKDVEFGHAVWDAATARYSFVPGGTLPNAVRVTVRKTKDSPNGSLHLFFANFFGSEKNMSVRAAAMLAPRDVAIVTDLSGSESYDSQLQNYTQTLINLWNVWVCLPIEKGNNGVGNGIDPPPPGLPPLNDGYGTGPGNPGNRAGADPKTDPGLTGPTWGRLYQWGTLEITTSYDPTTDAGLMHLPYDASWASDTELRNWFQTVGYSNQEITDLTRNNTMDWKYRVAVALGLARWDSGTNGGLWSTLPDTYTKSTKGNSNNRVDPGELAWLVTFPYKDGSKSSDMGYWMDYIDTYMRSSSTFLYQANPGFNCRFGIKTFVNYFLEKHRSYEQCPDLYKTPEQPLQAIKDAIQYSMDQLAANESGDQISLEIYGTTARHEVNLTKRFDEITNRIKAMQAGHYDGNTNMGGGIDQAIQELTSSRGRANASKVIFLLTDGNPNVTSSGTIDEVGGQQWALTKAQEAVNKHIQFQCVSVGTKANRILMQQIATLAGGQEFYASGTINEYSIQLREVFQELDGKRGAHLIE